MEPSNPNQLKVGKPPYLKRVIALVAIAILVFLTLPGFCQSCSDDYHHDGHVDNPPSFKYSREANENFDQKVENQHNHGHSHEHHHHGDHHDHENHHDYSGTEKTSKKPLDMFDVWVHSMGSTFLISAAPYLILFLIPLDNTEKMRPKLKVLLAFASGGLLGDAFLHLIPHATSDHSHGHGETGHDHHHHHSHNHNHSHEEHGHDMSVGLWVLSGIIAFLAVEKVVRMIKGEHGHSHGGAAKKKNENNSKKEVKEKEKAANNASKSNSTKGKKDNTKSKAKSTAHTGDEVEIAGYLNLAADFAHNFTDGLAIGASYLAGNSIGIVTTITILLHEVPHEIGDFAILIKSGCSKRKAMCLQLVTAVGAIAGTALALLGAGSDAAASWVLPFTAGGFIYIATVSVLPELLEESTKLGQSLKEISGLLAGVGLMVIITYFE